MRLRSFFAVAVLATAPACSPGTPEASSSGSWVGTITTEGQLSTVVNESGSVWGGTARLVEEASIGVEDGADEYMLGGIQGLHATEDRIFVIDAQVNVVRAYDHAGTFVGNIGGSGQGPGEYTLPGAVTTDAAGRVYVLDGRLYRINVYSSAGEVLETWAIPAPRCCAWPMFPADTAVWAPVRELDEETRNYRNGSQLVGPDGPHGEITWVPNVEYGTVTYSDDDGERQAPFSPWEVWTTIPGGGVAFRGSPDYRFDIMRPDGSKLVVHRNWEPIQIPAEQREWARRLEVAQRRRREPDWNWDGAEIPHYKPAFGSLTPALSGEMWVMREGESRRLADCAADPIVVGAQEARGRPCWDSAWILDVFGEDGRYLGDVELPTGVLPAATHLVVDGRVVVTLAQDDADTYMVKRYRLVLPGEQGR